MKTLVDCYKHELRGISIKFENDLINGMLSPILHQVYNDNNLSVEIRSNYINIYYRGGNLLRIREKAKLNKYSFEFDIRYCKKENLNKKEISKLSRLVDSLIQVDKWAGAFRIIKEEMDTYFASRTKLEREYQQLVVRENNIGQASKETDYFICDIEYQTKKTRLDLIAIKKSKGGRFRFSLIEMKYLDDALKGESGIVDHIKKVNDFLQVCDLDSLKDEMKGIINTKRRLGLVENLPDSIEFTDEIPEFVLLMANHKPASGILETELKKLKNESFFINFCKKANLKIATANFMGYGLFNDCIYSLDEFEEINKSLLSILNKRKG
jgi:hypothetical protein